MKYALVILALAALSACAPITRLATKHYPECAEPGSCEQIKRDQAGAIIRSPGY